MYNQDIPTFKVEPEKTFYTDFFLASGERQNFTKVQGAYKTRDKEKQVISL